MNPAQQKGDLTRVLVIHPEGNTFNNPSLKCLIDLLIKDGNTIDLRYPLTKAPVPQYAGIRLLPLSRILRLLKYFLFEYLCSWSLVFLATLVDYIFLYRKYWLIVGVDRQGLIEASIVSRLSNTPHILLSFEIMFESETSARYKRIERKAARNMPLWLVQDEVRASKLQEENHLKASNRFLLPLASAGAGVPASERLRDTLGIPIDKKVAITIGSVSTWSMTSELIRSTVEWPDDWVLLVHERYGRARDKLTAEIKAFSTADHNNKVFVSDSAAQMVDDLGSILAGVSIGLAFYKPKHTSRFSDRYEGNNLRYLGLSSGKISTYLRYGIPVLLNEIGIYAEEARRFGFGRVVERPECIKDVLDELDGDEYRNNARTYFSEKLDFRNYENAILARLQATRLAAHSRL